MRIAQVQKKYILDPLGYCWNHGYKVEVDHTSWMCHTASFTKKSQENSNLEIYNGSQ